MDGIAATEGGGRIIFMTTNYVEKLHPALIRPGRVDVKEYIGLASSTQLYKMFLRFFPSSDEKYIHSVAQEFVKKVKENTVSTAQLQGYLMSYRNNPSQAVENAGNILSFSSIEK